MAPAFVRRSRKSKVSSIVFAHLKWAFVMASEAEQLKPVLIAVDTEESSSRALAWALEQFASGTKPLSIHLVHVVRTLSTQLEIYLGCGPGSAYNFSDPTPHHEIQDVVQAKQFLHNR